jgi:hypothetical protein
MSSPTIVVQDQWKLVDRKSCLECRYSEMRIVPSADVDVSKLWWCRRYTHPVTGQPISCEEAKRIDGKFARAYGVACGPSGAGFEPRLPEQGNTVVKMPIRKADQGQRKETSHGQAVSEADIIARIKERLAQEKALAPDGRGAG